MSRAFNAVMRVISSLIGVLMVLGICGTWAFWAFWDGITPIKNAQAQRTNPVLFDRITQTFNYARNENIP
jgi:hypothetical protein